MMIKKYILPLILLLTLTIPAYSNTTNDSSLTELIRKQQFEKLFPHHHPIFSYENFITATKTFPRFANEGNTASRKKELAAFFANIAHETSGGWAEAPGGRYTWGLLYVEEQACKDGHCTQYNTAGSSNYQPVPGKSYYGRGPMQLTYAYNYGLAGAELQLPLLQQPELVSSNGVIAFKTALWFWMREQLPKPSCHDVICGNWKPTDEDLKLNRKPGFGMVINIINGGVECSSTDPAIAHQTQERIGYYKWFARIMNIEIEENCDCKGMKSYGL